MEDDIFGLKVLLLRAETLVGHSFENTLRGAGHPVTVISSREAACPLIDSMRPDLIVLDPVPGFGFPGSVPGRSIAGKLTGATGRGIDHRQVLLGTAIHEPGDYPVSIRLYREVHAEVIVSVIPEGYSPEEAAAMAALAEEGLPETLDDAPTGGDEAEASDEEDGKDS